VLVLSRHRDETLLINPGTPDEVRVMVVDIRGDNVRLGITAPAEFPVHRSEVWEAILRDRREGGAA